MPIQAAGHDIAISGHGEVVIYGGETEVPRGLELVVLAPPGASISDALGRAIEDGKKVEYLELSAHHGRVRFEPTVYRAGQKCPNYRVKPPLGLRLGTGGPTKVTVSSHTELRKVWDLVRKEVDPRRTLTRVFFLCCAEYGDDAGRLSRTSATTVGHGGGRTVTIGGGIWWKR